MKSFTVSDFLCWIGQQDLTMEYDSSETQAPGDVLFRFLEAQGLPVFSNSYDSYFLKDGGHSAIPIFQQPAEHYSNDSRSPYPSWGQAIDTTGSFWKSWHSYEGALQVALEFMIHYEIDNPYKLPCFGAEAPNPVTMESTLETLRLCQQMRDPENAHNRADKALCDFLTSLGYQQVVDEWKKVEKWYA